MALSEDRQHDGDPVRALELAVQDVGHAVNLATNEFNATRLLSEEHDRILKGNNGTKGLLTQFELLAAKVSTLDEDIASLKGQELERWKVWTVALGALGGFVSIILEIMGAVS